MTAPMDKAPVTQTHDDTLGDFYNEVNDRDKAKTIEKCITHKFTHATKPWITHYRSTLEEALPYQYSLEKLLLTLETPNKFCGKKLRERLREKYDTRFRVQDKIKLEPKAASDNVKHTYTLLQAAMLNFTDTESAEGHFSADSVTLSDPQDAPAEGSLSETITAQEFAGLSRSLDLGQAYQRNITQTFEVSSVQLQGMRLAKLNMKLAAYTKYFSGNIHQTLRQMLTQFTQGNDDISNGDLFNRSPIKLCSVQLFGKYVIDAVLIICRMTNESPKDSYILYIPNDPGLGFYKNANEDDCRTSLTVNILGTPLLQSLITSGLNKIDQKAFQATLGENTMSLTEDITFAPINTGLFNYLFSRHIDKLSSDVKQVAVPLAGVEDSIHRRRHAIHTPQRAPLSETLIYDFSKRMLTSATDTLLGEVFTGVEDWTSVEKQRAVLKLLELRELTSTDDVNDDSSDVQSADARTALIEYFKEFELEEHSGLEKNEHFLWKRTLPGYEQRAHVETRVKDQADVYKDDHRVLYFNNRHYIRIYGSVYEVERDPLAWRIRHPVTDSAYRPPLVYSPSSGWSLQYKRRVPRRIE